MILALSNPNERAECTPEQVCYPLQSKLLEAEIQTAARRAA